jgi:HD superfamily phosphohydrolase YqeK
VAVAVAMLAGAVDADTARARLQAVGHDLRRVLEESSAAKW